MLGIQSNVFSGYGELSIKAKVQTFPKEEDVSSFSFTFLLFSKCKHILKNFQIISGAQTQV